MMPRMVSALVVSALAACDGARVAAQRNAAISQDRLPPLARESMTDAQKNAADRFAAARGQQSGTRREQVAEMREVTSGLEFPEGPVVMSDGSVIVVEIKAGRITRVGADGSKETVAEPGGGPNGAQIGPDGKLWVCNNGSAYDYHDVGGQVLPVQPPSAGFDGTCRIPSR